MRTRGHRELQPDRRLVGARRVERQELARDRSTKRRGSPPWLCSSSRAGTRASTRCAISRAAAESTLARVLLVFVLLAATAAAVTPPPEYVVLAPLVAWTVLWRRRILARTAPGSPPRPGTVAPSPGGARQGPRPSPW
ncbi:hypothetical protein AB0D59_23875 [Streptomyces sp. NPDC048417]|uniref:hypothetical protein n=1 Tax=Streptomyces sp. NPDC048417 TaxID=3155387 RepID=UPI00344681A0